MASKIEPLDDWISVTVRRDLSPEARSRNVADFARRELLEAQEKNRRVLGRTPPHETFVDGRKGARLESVNPDRGVIIFEFEMVFDVLKQIGEMLRARSPVVSGAYREGHTLFADGKEVPLDGVIPAAAEYVMLNPLPYSRRIEIGKTKSGRAFVMQVPNRIYERTAADARRRFGNIVKITFGYRAAMGRTEEFSISRIGPLRVLRNAKGQFLNGSHVRAGNQQERSLRVPAIVVTMT